jgi:hypothetical protein
MASVAPVEAAPAVVIVDRVTLPRTSANDWIARLRAEYLPGAQDRGLRLAGVWTTRGTWAAPGVDAVEVVVTWTLAALGDFWRSRAGGSDPAVRAWWQATDALALHRSRKVLAPEAAPA